MPKVLITGNGFDLNFNLPTTYSDFINILNSLEKNNNIDFESIYSNSNNFENIKSNFNNNIEFDIERITSLKILIKNNLWYKFFKNELNIETWIDFENKIQYVLDLFLSSLSLVKENFFGKNPLSKISTYKSTTLNNNLETINVLGFFGIFIIDEYFNWSFNRDFLIKKYNYFIDLNTKKIVEFLNQQLIDFKNIFNEYFNIFVQPLYDKSLVKHDRNFLNGINYYFTFNYTPSFENYFNSKIKSNYLHGKINSEKNSLVLGINDVPNDVKDKIHYLPFTKYYQKLNNNTDFYFLNEIKKQRLDNFMFFFWGHSLDSSDADYINEVFDFISEHNSKIKKIVVVYHNEHSKSQLLLNLLDIRGKGDIVQKMRNKNLIFCQSNSNELNTELNLHIPNVSYGPSVH